jgi:hypothetical protein
LPLDGGEHETGDAQEDAEHPEDEDEDGGVGGIVLVGFEDGAGEEAENAEEGQKDFSLANPEAGEFKARGCGFVENPGNGVEENGNGNQDEGPGTGGLVENAVERHPEKGRCEEGGDATEEVVEESGTGEYPSAAHKARPQGGEKEQRGEAGGQHGKEGGSGGIREQCGSQKEGGTQGNQGKGKGLAVGEDGKGRGGDEIREKGRDGYRRLCGNGHGHLRQKAGRKMARRV